MRRSHEWNFAARLIDRLSPNSALIDAASGQTVSSNEISGSIAGFAAGLLANGLQRGDRLLISCGINSGSTLAYLGALYAGIVPVLVDERMLAENGEHLFARVSSRAAWTDGRAGWRWAKDNGFPQFEGAFAAAAIDSLEAAACEPNDLAVLMPTSGSSGVPRLVMVTHGNLIANTEAIVASQDLIDENSGSNEKAMLIMPVSYCFGASVMHSHLYSGGAVVFDSRFMFPDKVLQAVYTHGCTTFAGVPTVYNILLRRSNLASIGLPKLRRFLQAGGALASESIQELRRIVPSAKFYAMYGQTEATARISCLPADRIDDKLGSAGIPLDNVKVRIVDEAGDEVATGKTGEIEVAGPSVCAGYLDDPEATSRKFVEGRLRTGDLGSLDDAGFLWIKGRTAEFVKIRGYRVSLADVEAKVAAIPGVCECAAAGVQHPEAGEALAVFVVEDDSRTDDAETLMERVRGALPVHWTCASVKVVAELPKTPNGKIARSRLQTIA